MLKRFVKRILYDHLGIEVIRVPADKKNLIRLRTDPRYIDVLHEPEFQRSVESVRFYTSLDTARLANLWQLCRLSNPQGNMLEAGVYRGGASLHLHNAAPDRKIFLCDTFEGFRGMEMDVDLDRRFRPDFKPSPKVKRASCTDTSVEMVHDLLSRCTRNFQIIKGIFPASDVNKDVKALSFVHLDFDLYSSTFETLQYIEPRLIERSIIVLDDYKCQADGVVKAVAEFTVSSRKWIAVPIYPGQGILLHRSWFDA
jgi:O-methyltransferase